MKIVIPIAGIGTRLRPHTHAIPKALIKIAGRRIIDYILDQLLKLNFSEIIFILGYLGDRIKSYLTEVYGGKVNMRFIWQNQTLGLGHAVYITKEFAETEDLLIVLGDTIFFHELSGVVNSGNNMIGVMFVEEPQKYGVVKLGQENIIMDVVEKPSKPPSNLAIAGIYYFNDTVALFESLEEIIRKDIKTKNEYQLTDAIKLMLNRNIIIKAFFVNEIYDCGEKNSLLETNKILLMKHPKFRAVEGSIIIPPVYISDTAEIRNSIIGPNVSIHDEVFIKDSIIVNSIVDDRAVIEQAILNNSLIGSDAYVKEGYRELNIGPDSELYYKS